MSVCTFERTYIQRTMVPEQNERPPRQRVRMSLDDVHPSFAHVTCRITVSMMLIFCRPTMSPSRPARVAQTSFAQTYCRPIVRRSKIALWCTDPVCQRPTTRHLTVGAEMPSP